MTECVNCQKNLKYLWGSPVYCKACGKEMCLDCFLKSASGICKGCKRKLKKKGKKKEIIIEPIMIEEIPSE